MVDVPNAADLKTRYPEFANVADARVTLFIDEAATRVDSTWREADQSPAIMSLACHQMSLEGEPSLSASPSGKTNLTGGKFLKSRKVGDTSNEWSENTALATAASKSATAAQADYRSTVYGVKFLRLLRMNFAGPVAV